MLHTILTFFFPFNIFVVSFSTVTPQPAALGRSPTLPDRLQPLSRLKEKNCAEGFKLPCLTVTLRLQLLRMLVLYYLYYQTKMNYVRVVSICEQCILFFVNLMKLLCQTCTCIKWFYVIFYNFWRRFRYYYHYFTIRLQVEVWTFLIS
jgi:hypothetical protein